MGGILFLLVKAGVRMEIEVGEIGRFRVGGRIFANYIRGK